ncbi:MAG: cytochrome c [Acidobacteria bacterium]|nr:cytochrome c [Acidobacteriota bacterium]
MRIISVAGLAGWILVATATGTFAATAQGQGTGSNASSAAPAGNAANGKKLYNAIGCWQCHGYSGQGGAATKIAPNPISYPSFTKYIRAPKGQMPPYTTKVLSESDLGDIYAFLLTIPKPPDPKTIPLLNSN